VQRGGTVFYASGSPSHVSGFLNDFAKIERDRKSIIILEDIDSLIARYGEAEYLEMLDSAKTINNVLFIATTNYPERLDPRIYNRPGRFSHVVKIGLPGATTREAYLKAILKNHKDVAEIVSKTSGFTIDHLTSLVNGTYREKKELHKEIERLRVLFKVPKTEEKPLGIGATFKETE
jgi:SpoVK/Ycf46/Vps4 family AAA+-type ATPase